MPIANGLSIAYDSNTTSPFDFGTTATYTCIEGYTLSGSETRMCKGDGLSVQGEWSGTTPICSSMNM